MSRVLLDTHAFLWFLFDDPRISENASSIIADEKNEKLLSMTSLWEITIKAQIGKLELGMDFNTFLRSFVQEADINVIDTSFEHLRAYKRLPLIHRDPFDRMLIAQAQTENLSIVTKDEQFKDYGLTLLW